MHRFRRATQPERVELHPPASADHATWIMDRRPRLGRRAVRAAPAQAARPVAVRDCFWITRLL